MNRKPSLLMVTVWARKGGAERILLDLLERLSDEVHATLGFVRPVGDDRRTLRWDGPTVGLREVLFGKWDVIHTHLFLPGLLVRIRRIWDGSFRWVHTVHYDDYGALRFGSLKRWLDHRFVFPATDVLVATSPGGRSALEPLPQVRLIENAIPLDRPEEATPEKADPPAAPRGADAGSAGVPPGDVVVGTVAHLRPEKGVEDLIRAVAVLRRRGRTGVRLRIAGDGPLRRRLEELAETLRIMSVVDFRGFVHDLDGFYRELDVYVQPSRSERFGLAALESMRFGLPLVAAEVGFLPELLGGGRFGELVARREDRERDAFHVRVADAVERVLSDPGAFADRAGRGLEHWRERLDPERMASRYAEAYRDALRPRICMVQPIVTQRGGGIARQLFVQSRELVRRGHRVFLVQRADPALPRDRELRDPEPPNPKPRDPKSRDREPRSPELPDREPDDRGRAARWRHLEILEAGGIEEGTQGPGGVFARLRGLRFVAGTIVRLWTLRHRVDVIHAHQLYSPTLAGAAAKTLLGTPLVVTVTSSGELGERAQLRRLPFRRSRRLAFRAVDRVLVLTDVMGEEMRDLGFPDDRIRLVPNAVEVPPEEARWRPGPSVPHGRAAGHDPTLGEEPDLGEGPDPAQRPFALLYVGRLSEEKRLRTLLGAAAILGRRGRTVRVDLVGGPDPDRNVKPELETLAATMPDRAEVRFHGHRSDVGRYYGRSDAFVLASSTEGLSNALLEAMAHGVPCIVSDIPQNRFATGAAALTFPVGCADALADAVDDLIRDRASGGERSRRLSEAARRRARKTFSVDAVVDRLEAVYEEVDRGGASRRPRREGGPRPADGTGSA